MMIMQEVWKKRSVYDGSGVHGDAALSRHERRLGHARSLLHEMESRLASTFDTAQVATSDTHREIAQPIQVIDDECKATGADVTVDGDPQRPGASMHRLLRCLELGGVHEICSLGLHASWTDTPREMAGARQDVQATLCREHAVRGDHAVDDSPAAVSSDVRTDTVSASYFVTPYAVLMFLAQWIASKHDGPEKSGSPCHVAWIGDRVHPDFHAFRAIPCLKHGAEHAWRGARARASSERGLSEWCRHGADGKHDLASRSFLVRDSDRAFAPVRHGHLARNARARRTNLARLEMDARACNRLWCAEQAIRMGAAGVLIVDGTGFSSLAWRRLQLASDAASDVAEDVMEDCAPPKSSVRAGLHRKPCVLVVVPSDMRGQASGCAATARWSVHAAVPECIHQMHSCEMDAAAANPSGEVGFAWRLKLVSARRFGLQALACGGEDSIGGEGVEIVMSRSAAGERAEQCWRRVAERAARRRRAHAIHHVPQAPVAVGVRETGDLDNTLGKGVLATLAAHAEAAVDADNEDVLGGVRAWRARSA